MKKYTFSTITFRQIKSVISIKKKINKKKFEQWFNFPYNFNENELQLLKSLIKKNQLRIEKWSEEELKAKLLVPLINEVDFNIGDEITDWYERSLKTIINDVELSGTVDFLVAEGYSEPEIPYFFIQEFKPSFPARSPEDQLLAELLVALHLNNVEEMKGAYITGQHWKFMILEKMPDDKYQFYVSKNFDALKINDLKDIFKNLMAVKEVLVELKKN